VAAFRLQPQDFAESLSVFTNGSHSTQIIVCMVLVSRTVPHMDRSRQDAVALTTRECSTAPVCVFVCNVDCSHRCSGHWQSFHAPLRADPRASAGWLMITAGLAHHCSMSRSALHPLLCFQSKTWFFSSRGLLPRAR
jgi:hypothetical protein